MKQYCFFDCIRSDSLNVFETCLFMYFEDVIVVRLYWLWLYDYKLYARTTIGFMVVRRWMSFYTFEVIFKMPCLYVLKQKILDYNLKFTSYISSWGLVIISSMYEL